MRDRIRVFAIAILESGEQLTSADIDELEQIMLGAPGADESEAQAEIRGVRAFLSKRQRLQSLSTSSSGGAAASGGADGTGTPTKSWCVKNNINISLSLSRFLK